MENTPSESDLADALRGKTSRRELLKRGAVAGVAVAWAVPAMEVLGAQVAAATSPPPTTTPSVTTNISWVMLVFQDAAGTWYLWNSDANSGAGGFAPKITGIGSVPASNFQYFAFYSDLGGITGFTTPGPSGLSVSFVYDSSGDMDLSLSGAPSGLELQYVIVHGGANAYNGSTGSIVASDGTGSYANGDSPVELGLSVPSSMMVADSLQYFDAPATGTQYDLGYVVGNT